MKYQIAELPGGEPLWEGEAESELDAVRQYVDTIEGFELPDEQVEGEKGKEQTAHWWVNDGVFGAAVDGRTVWVTNA